MKDEEWELDEKGLRFYWHVPSASCNEPPFRVYETPEEKEWYDKQNKDRPRPPSEPRGKVKKKRRVKRIGGPGREHRC